jgi:hypothetical protein
MLTRPSLFRHFRSLKRSNEETYFKATLSQFCAADSKSVVPFSEDHVFFTHLKPP